jgi:hypothetical protein
MSTPQSQPSQKKWQDIVPASSKKIAPKKAKPRRPSIVSRLKRYVRSLLQRFKNMAPRKRTTIIAVVLSIVISTGVLIYIFINNQKPSMQDAVDGKTPFSTALLPKGTPDYKTILPKGKTIEDFGGWTRVSPSSAAPVYAYLDTLGASPIRVSEQPLPEGFSDDTEEQVRALAEDLNAKEVISVRDTTVYVGTSSKGPQSIVFTKNNLLILIRSSVVIDNKLWAEYIDSLQ